MKLFILETKLYLIMDGFSSLLSMWIDRLSGICVTSAFCSCCEQDLMLCPNTHLLIFIFSTQRSDGRGSRLHCQTTAADHRFTWAKTCMFAETQSTLTHFDLSHWSASSVKSPVLYNTLQLYSDFWQFEWIWWALIGSVWSVKDMNKPIKGLDDWPHLICSIWLGKVIN